MNTGGTDQVRVKVHQMAIRPIWVQRTVIVEIPAELLGDQTRIEEIIRSGEQEYGPFYWDPMDKTECLELIDTVVEGQADEVPDVRAAQVN